MTVDILNDVKFGLKKFPADAVEIYCSYLKKLILAKKKDKITNANPFMHYFTLENAIDRFKVVAANGFFIDGELILLQSPGRVSYQYQAYKNKVLLTYPNAVFDIQLVHDGDTISFKKESGKVIYSHVFENPFSTTAKIIGAYVVIKIKGRGDFLEILKMDDVVKMKAAAKTKDIWDKWFGEMVLKSVIKRACKRHFFDITCEMDEVDNENYDLNKGNGIDLKKNDDKKEKARVLKHINNSKNLEQLGRVSGMVNKYDLITEFDNKMLMIKDKLNEK